MSANATALLLVPPCVALLLPGSGAEPATPADPIAPRDAWGDPLPPGALFRTGTIRALHHVSGASCFSPDRKLLAATGSGNTIQLFDVATGKEVRTLRGHKEQVMDLGFSADGKTLVSASRDKTARLWDVNSGNETGCFTGHEREVWQAVLSPCGTWVASSDCHEIRFWDRQTGKQTLLIPFADTMFALALSSDGKLVAVESHDTSIHIWETATGKPLQQFQGTESKLEYPCYFLSEDKTLLTQGHGGGLTLWDVATAKKIRQFDTGYPIALSPDGNVVAVGNPHWHSGRGDIRLWDLTTGKQIQKLRGHAEGSGPAAFSPDGTMLLSLGGDRTLRRWDLKTGEELGPRIGHQNAVKAVAFSPDSKLLASGSDDQTLRFWDPLTGRQVRRIAADQEFFQGIVFLPDGKTLLSQTDVVPSGQPYARTSDDALTRVRLWDVATGEAGRHFDHRKAFIHIMAFSPARQLLAQGGFHTLRLLDIAEGESISPPNTDKNRPQGMAFSPDGKLLAMTSDDSGIRETTGLSLYDLEAGKPRWQTRRTFESFKDVSFLPDGKVIVTGGTYIRLWDAATGKEIGHLDGGHGHRAHRFDGGGHLALSHDGRTLATFGEEQAVVLWEIATRQVRQRFAGHDISCMAFSPDGRLLATGGVDTLVMVWDVTGRLQDGSLRPAPADDKSLESLWARLGDSNAAVAHEAAWSLVSSPKQAVPFLRQRLPFMPNPDEKRVQQLVAALDNPQFAVRRSATEKLENLGPAAEQALRDCLERRPSLETRQRAERLLAMIEGSIENPALRRGLRLVEVLEHIGTPAAKEVVSALAERALVARLQEEAKRTLGRMERSPRASQAEESAEMKRPNDLSTERRQEPVRSESDSTEKAEASDAAPEVATSRGTRSGRMLPGAIVGVLALMLSAVGVMYRRLGRGVGKAVRN
jgi:WD40 repeat protein